MNFDIGQVTAWAGGLTGVVALISVLLKARRDARTDRINDRIAQNGAATAQQDLDERIAAAGRARVAEIVDDNNRLRSDVNALAAGFNALRRMLERSPGHATPTDEERRVIDAASEVANR